MCILRVYKTCEQKLSFIILLDGFCAPPFLKTMYCEYFTITVMITTFFQCLCHVVVPPSQQIY